MKKTLITAFALATLLPALAYAKTDLSISPLTQSVTAGQRLAVTVMVVPSGDTDYTVKLALSYPSDILEATSFSFAPSWLGLSQPGYDSMDAGSIVKTAGYPGGVSATAQFGTVTFIAKKSGTATIAVGAGTQIYNASNQNVFSGTLASAQVIVGGTAPAPKAAPAPVKAAPAKATTVAPAVSVTAPAAQATSSFGIEPQTVDQAAAAAAAVPASSSAHYSLYIIGLIILAGVFYLIWRKMSAPKPKRRRRI